MKAAAGMMSSPRFIVNNDDKSAGSDNSTCTMSEDSEDSERSASTMCSSVSASTCDFDHNLSLSTTLTSCPLADQWVAAKRGDYATLLYISKHKDPAIWTQKDKSGNVPLYYACNSGGAHGKYGLKAVKLLIEVWQGEIPMELLELCKKNSINRDVSNVLDAATSKGDSYGHIKCTILPSLSYPDDSSDKEVLIEGLNLVLSDIGDDGFVEDY